MVYHRGNLTPIPAPSPVDEEREQNTQRIVRKNLSPSMERDLGKGQYQWREHIGAYSRVTRQAIRAVLICLLLIVIPTIAQENNTAPLITAENITRLQSVATIAFADIPDAQIDSGWFALNHDGQYAAVIGRRGVIVLLDLMTADTVDSLSFIGENDQPATVLDAAFSPDGQFLAALHTDAEHYYVSIYNVTGAEDTQFFPLELDNSLDMPVRIWLDNAHEYLWLEVLAMDNPHYIMRVPLASDEDVVTLPSGPENDKTAFVRIGRIPAPLAITSTQDGLTKLWNLETGEVTAEVQLDIPPVFGRIDETNGTHLAWRDPESTALYLLDFETGKNQMVAPLNGQYIQALMVTPDADVIIGVAVDDDPVVWAWDVSTGEQVSLGEYRDCSRVPDLVHLSADGTTLVIGCDAGLDIWRVASAD